MANASYAARQPPAVEGEEPVHVLVTGFGVSKVSIVNFGVKTSSTTRCSLFVLALEIFSSECHTSTRCRHHDEVRSRKVAAETHGWEQCEQSTQSRCVLKHQN